MTAGGLVSVVYLISTLGQLLGGQLADRFDERLLYMLSYGLQVGVLIIAALTDNILLLAIVAIAVSVQTGTQPIENCLVARFTPTDWRATVYGLKFVISLGLSALGVPLLAFIFAQSGGFDAAFWAMASFAGIAVMIALFLPSSRGHAGMAANAPPALKP